MENGEPQENCLFIELENRTKTFSPGQSVKGHVVLRGKVPHNVKGLKIYLEGKERVIWPENHIHTDVVPTFSSNGAGVFQPIYMHKTTTVDVTAEKEIISLKLALAGDGNRVFRITEGTYPFKFTLPRNLPSSFIHDNGTISYILKADLLRPLLPNWSTEVPLCINGILDLGQEATARKSQTIQETEKDGQICFTVNLKRSGYVPGENLDFTCEIVNNSTTTVEYVRASVIQVIKFKAGEGERQCRTQAKPVFEVESVPVYPRSDISWRAPYRTIPPVPPTRLGGLCNLIDVQYFLQFKVSISGFIINSSIDERLPILIGTVPLQGGIT